MPRKRRARRPRRRKLRYASLGKWCKRKGFGGISRSCLLAARKADELPYENKLRFILPPRILGVSNAKVSTRVK